MRHFSSDIVNHCAGGEPVQRSSTATAAPLRRAEWSRVRGSSEGLHSASHGNWRAILIIAEAEEERTEKEATGAAWSWCRFIEQTAVPPATAWCSRMRWSRAGTGTARPPGRRPAPSRCAGRSRPTWACCTLKRGGGWQGASDRYRARGKVRGVEAPRARRGPLATLGHCQSPALGERRPSMPACLLLCD